MSRDDGVLTTDAGSNANLAVVRSLGRRGVPVGVCGAAGELNLGFFSRYATERCVLPSPARDPDGFVAGLGRVLAGGRYPVLLPTSDRTIHLVSAARAALPSWVTIPIPDADALDVAQDKERTLALARALGVSAPATWCPEGPADLAACLDEVPYPAIVKPRLSNFLTGAGQQKVGYEIARTRAELVRAYARVHAQVPRPLVQEMVGGHGSGIFSIWDRGTPLAWFAHRRLREVDPRGGPAAAAVSVPVAPELAQAAAQLLKALRWHGVAMVEFRHEPASGRSWLMEINGRFWGSLGLSLAAGVDFPWYLRQLARGEPVEPPASYPIGVLARDAVGEYKHFLRVMTRRRAAGAPPPPSRLATLRQAGTILHPWKDSFNWVADDPAPGRREWRHAIARLLRAA